MGKELEKGSEDSKIKFTPTIFIKRNELPKQYNADDLKEIVKSVFTKAERVVTNEQEKILE